MKSNTQFTLSQRIKAATIVFAVMAVADAALLLFFRVSGRDIAFSTASIVPIFAGLTLGGLFAMSMKGATFKVQLISWLMTSIASALAFSFATYAIFF